MRVSVKNSGFKKLIFGLLLSSLVWLPAGAVWVAQAENFANPAFQKVWAQSDQPVKQGQANRTWLWGPEPGLSRQESYAEAPDGQRLVQYFDKSRMELTNPAANPNTTFYVTNGLLARELVSGRVQTGDNRFEARTPAQVPVAGDPGNAGPTYASFTALASLNNDKRAERKSGFVTQSIDRAGHIGTTTTSLNLANYAYYNEELGHNIPDVFYGTFLLWKSQFGLDWVYALGYPLTEPFWSTFKVAGVDKEVLVQIYERRALTFTPGNSPGFLVEFGNIGQHYLKWRYDTGTAVEQPATTAPATTTASGTMPPAATTAAPATTAVPPATTAPPATTTRPASTTLDAEESQFLQLINQYRVAQGLGQLQLNDNLVTASKWLSNDMASKNYFSHTDSLGRDMGKRLSDFSYTKYPQGENIAAGFTTAQLVFQGWKDSPGHNANMLGRDYQFIGIGRAFNAASTYQWYWTIDLGGSQ